MAQIVEAAHLRQLMHTRTHTHTPIGGVLCVRFCGACTICTHCTMCGMCELCGRSYDPPYPIVSLCGTYSELTWR